MNAAQASALIQQVAERLSARALRVATAESCTGGLLAKTLTDLPGSSQWFERGWVTYSNAAKTELLDVDPHTLDTHGAVSEATVRAMAAGALRHSHADLAVAISGVAGPGGGSAINPVGSVWLAWAYRQQLQAQHYHFSGGRETIREAASMAALQGLLQLLEENA